MSIENPNCVFDLGDGGFQTPVQKMLEQSRRMPLPIQQNKCNGLNCNGMPIVQSPVWPSNSPNEIYYAYQSIFNRDNHNHDQVLQERYYNLPYLTEANLEKPQPLIVDGSFQSQTMGKVIRVPFSTENYMHTHWDPYRLQTNQIPPHGSDSHIFFQGVNPAETYTEYLDWLDKPNNPKQGNISKSIDDGITQSCSGDPTKMVCSPTCIDWWTNRPMPPQGGMMGAEGRGGCRWGEVQGLSCYPCTNHLTYATNK